MYNTICSIAYSALDVISCELFLLSLLHRFVSNGLTHHTNVNCGSYSLVGHLYKIKLPKIYIQTAKMAINKKEFHHKLFSNCSYRYFIMFYGEVTDHPCVPNHVLRTRGIGQLTEVGAVECLSLSRRPHPLMKLVEDDAIFR